MTAPGARSAAPADEALVARFREALARLWPEGGKLGLAVSGGPDSLAMLLLAEAAISGGFEVATVEHGLRPEAADECAMVARLCTERGIPCEVLPVTVASGNLQAEARAARYAALTSWAARRGLSALATAHHADDQAETLLMRLNRGSGVAGLAGVRERGRVPAADLPLVRPLLAFRRAELEQVVRAAGVAAVNDPSNANDRFERVRMRQGLAEAKFLDPAAIAAAADHLSEADEALDWAARIEWEGQVAAGGEEIRYNRRAPLAAL
jgi:tRNA(Ile)-lysidine synthase